MLFLKSSQSFSSANNLVHNNLWLQKVLDLYEEGKEKMNNQRSDPQNSKLKPHFISN